MAYVRYVNLERGDEVGEQSTTDRPPPEPEELTDSELLKLFPGRTLEELDQMDLNRLHRVLEARSMERVEERRKLFLAGKLEAKDLDADEWGLIVAMDGVEKEGEN